MAKSPQRQGPVSRRQRVYSKESPRNVSQPQETSLEPVMAPIGGLNFKDSIITMPPTDAIIATNVLMRTNGVQIRGGWKQWATNVIDGANTEVASVVGYLGASTIDNKVFAMVGSKIYDVTAGGNAPTVAATTTATDGIWSHVHHSNTANKTFLCAANNGGGFYTYDSTGGWIKRALTSGPSNIDNITSVTSSKNRLWFTFAGNSSVWYLGLGNISGPLTEFPLGPLLSRGGYLQACTNWTRDAGQTVDDFFVAFGSQGNVIVYSGSDPASSTTWGLVGNWDVGAPPIGPDFFCKRGSDVMLVTARGVLPLSQVISGQFDPESPSTAYSVKINNALVPAVNGQMAQQGWGVYVLPKADALLVTQPTTVNSTNTQWVMSLTTSAWSTFDGVDVRSADVIDRTFYFGRHDGVVAIGFEDSTTSDGQLLDGTLGATIQADVQPAFNPFNSPGLLKTFDAARMIFIAPSQPSVSVQMNTQFNIQAVPGSPSFATPSGSLFDVARWDQSRWSGGNATFEAWIGLTGVGYYGSLRVVMRGLPGTAWSAAHILYKAGSSSALM